MRGYVIMEKIVMLSPFAFVFFGKAIKMAVPEYYGASVNVKLRDNR